MMRKQPTRRIGLRRNNQFASLHPNAQDSHANIQPWEETCPPATEEEDINRPPDGSDGSDSDEPQREEEEESSQEQSTSSTQDTVFSSPQVSTATATTTSKYDLTGDSAKILRRPGKAKATYGKGAASMPKKQGLVRAPKAAKTIPGSRLLPPPPVKSLNNDPPATGFDHCSVPLKKKGIEAESQGLQSPPKRRNSNSKNPGIEIFTAPPGSGSTTRWNSESSEDLDIAKFLHAPPPARRKDSEVLGDDLRSLSKRTSARVRGTKTASEEAATDGPSPPKKRRTDTSLVVDFVAPPVASKSEALSAPLLEDALVEVESHEIQADGQHNDWTSGRCAVCSARIDKQSIESYRNRNRIPFNERLTYREQELLHKFHSKLDAERQWRTRHYPIFRWQDLPFRLEHHTALISDLIRGQRESYYAVQVQKIKTRRGRKTFTLAEEQKTGETSASLLGYYGTRGQRIISDWLVHHFQLEIKAQSLHNKLIDASGGPGGFMQKVLIPELFNTLIVEDMRQSSELEAGALARVDQILQADRDVTGLTLAEIDLRETTWAAQEEEGIEWSILELEESKQKAWLARYLAKESAHCGIILSEEADDVVPLDQPAILHRIDSIELEKPVAVVD